MLNSIMYKLMQFGFFPNKTVLWFWKGKPVIVDRWVDELLGLSIYIAFCVGMLVCWVGIRYSKKKR